ncbi:MAG: nucleotidyltransferase family protein [Firmicutes bacterium]|nr:nucleotidyltransferase family protein [Bacillota bacterium]
MQAAINPEGPVHDITPLIPEGMREGIPIYVDAIRALNQFKVPFVVVGGIAMLEYGRTRITKDIDFLVYKQDALRLLDLLPLLGYKTQRTDDNWVYHAFKGGQIIDILFALGKGFLGDPEGVVLTDEILARGRPASLDGAVFLVASPEDIIHSKLLVSWKATRQEDFQDVLLMIRNTKKLDWDYLFGKISRYPERALALLSYAVSCQITEDKMPIEIKSEIEDLSRLLFRRMGIAA